MNRKYGILADIAAKVIASKAITDKATLGADLLIDVNANGNPYMRWTKSGNQYQLLLTPSNIRYEKNTGSGWTTVWTK